MDFLTAVHFINATIIRRVSYINDFEEKEEQNI